MRGGEVSGEKGRVGEEVGDEIVGWEEGLEGVVVGFGLEDFMLLDFREVGDKGMGRDEEEIGMGMDWG